MSDEPIEQSDEPTAQSGSAEHEETSSPDAAKAAVDALRRATRSTAPRRKTSAQSSRSGGSRDPRPVSEALDALLAERGWQDDSAIALLMTNWTTIAGADLASHVTPTSFEAGVLTLQAESTAWATQIRLLLPDLHKVIDAEIGRGKVTSLLVVGPSAPNWTKGPRKVAGRGPRDTYG